jgi:prepilin-type processing-associated H-X9-DG protein
LDLSSEIGVAVKRIPERVLAAVGKLDEAPPRFEAAESVARGGVLVALPVLVAQGYFDVFYRVYRRLKNGFYGLNSVVATLAVMALLRLRTIEQLPFFSPGEFGLLLGLDRAPEVKTVRRKLGELGRRGKGLELVEAFAREWLADQGEEVAGFLFVDGHVRPYHGRKHKLPKTHVPRRRLCMPATTDFWVNDAYSDPLFFVTAPANEGLLSMLDDEVLPEVRELLGPERRLTLVLDREAWSPKTFRRWSERGIDVLTYRKGSYRPWPEERFQEVEVPGQAKVLRLAEAPLSLSNGLRVREVRCLGKKAHQVSIVTTRWDLSLSEVAARMFARWRQENFFRYMRHEFALDHLPTNAVERADPERRVPNPARKAKAKEYGALRTDLRRLREELGHAAFHGNGQDHSPDPGDLKEKITDLERRIATTKYELAALPEKIPLKQLMPVHEIVQLERERKRISDAIKMAAYRAETELAALAGPSLGTHHQDEARSFLRQVFHLPADLMPDEDRLLVRLHAMANPRANRVLNELCHILNGYEARFPGTSLRVVLEPPALQS